MRAVAHVGSPQSETAAGTAPEGLPGRYARIASVNRAPRNPYLTLLYRHLGDAGLHHEAASRLSARWLVRNRRRIGYLHVHWPEVLYRFERGPRALRPLLSWVKAGWLAVRLLAARALGYRLVWTIHQVYPHESTGRRLDRAAERLLARTCHVLLAHDQATARSAERELGLGGSRIAVVPHGSYVGVYPAGRSREDVRAALGLAQNGFAFLAFGELRAYKGIDVLLAAWAAARLPASAGLVIAGNAKEPAVARSVEQAAAADPRITLLPGFLPAEGVAELYGACDAAILARADGGTSGSLILALSLGVPVVRPRSPAYDEVLGGARADWLFRPGDVASLRDALEVAAGSAEGARERAAAARARADELAWPGIARRTAELLAAVRPGRR